MSTLAIGPRSSRGWLATVAAGVVAIAVSIGIVVGTADLPSFDLVVVLAVAALTLWCATTRHPMLALVVVAVYIGAADGFVKLRINSDPASLLRDVLLFAVLSNLLLRWNRHRDTDPLSLPGLTVWVLAYAGIVLVQLANPQTTSLLQGLAGMRLHLEFVPLFFVGALLVRRAEDIYRFMGLLVLVGTVNSFVNLVQFNLTLDQFAAWGPGYREKLFGGGHFASSARVGFVGADGHAIVRPFGLGSDIGFGGAAATLALPSCIALALWAKTPWRALAFSTLAIVNLVGVITCGARVAIVGAVVAVTFFLALAALSRRATRTILTTVVVAVAATVALPAIFSGSQSGAFERLQSVSPLNIISSTDSARGGSTALIPEYLQKYTLGAGIGRSGSAFQFSNVDEHLDAENELTFLAVETGVIGLLVMLILHVRVVTLALRGRRRQLDPRMRLALIALVAPVLASMATWIAAPATAATPYVCYFWFVAGVVARFSTQPLARP